MNDIKDGWEVSYISQSGIKLKVKQAFIIIDEDGWHHCNDSIFEIYNELIKLGKIYEKTKLV